MALPIWAYVGGGALLAGALAGWTVRDWKADSDQLAAVEKAQKEERRLRDMLQRQAEAYEGERDDAESQSESRRIEIRTVYRDRPVRAECAVPADVRGLLVGAVNAANARTSGQPEAPVPGPAASPGPVDRP